MATVPADDPKLKALQQLRGEAERLSRLIDEAKLTTRLDELMDQVIAECDVASKNLTETSG
jgi:broad-specificity NMP kinase